MKKYVIKATALAIGALVGGSAFAAIDFTASPAVTTGKYASEISYAKTTGQAIAAGTKPTQTAVGAAAVAAVGETTLKTKLGFGVSTGQQRYIRIDLTGLKLGAAAASDDLNDITNSFGLAGANRTVVAGGSVDDSYIIYQITGANAAGHAASNVISWAAPALRTTAGNGTAPTITYALYETAVAAANNVAGTSLYSSTGTFFNFASGYKVTANVYKNTALVADGFKKFSTSAGTPTTTASKAEIGNVTVVADTANVLRGDGTGVVLGDFFAAAGNKIVFKGDFTPKGANAGVTVGAAGTCAAIGGSTTSVATDKQSVTWTTTAVADLASVSLCFDQDQTVAQPAQTFTYDLNPVAVATNVTLVDPAAATIGEVVRDGTVLQAPFATIHPDYLSRVVLTSQSGADVNFTASVIAEDGVTCSTGTYSGVLKAGKMLVINTKDICPSLTGGATRLAVQVVAATPLNTIHGVYNVMNYDSVTGKTNSLISYPMVRPTEN